MITLYHALLSCTLTLLYALPHNTDISYTLGTTIMHIYAYLLCCNTRPLYTDFATQTHNTDHNNITSNTAFHTHFTIQPCLITQTHCLSPVFATTAWHLSWHLKQPPTNNNLFSAIQHNTIQTITSLLACPVELQASVESILCPQ
jgi:hypothetical protein